MPSPLSLTGPSSELALGGPGWFLEISGESSSKNPMWELCRRPVVPLDLKPVCSTSPNIPLREAISLPGKQISSSTLVSGNRGVESTEASLGHIKLNALFQVV